MLPQRNTKYVKAVQEYVTRRGHATNAEILTALKQDYPYLSATTVHRITTRLFHAKKLQLAPPSKDGAMRYDANLGLHDHFYCTDCRQLKDVVVASDIFEKLQNTLEGYKVQSRLTIQGICSTCIRHRQQT